MREPLSDQQKITGVYFFLWRVIPSPGGLTPFQEFFVIPQRSEC